MRLWAGLLLGLSLGLSQADESSKDYVKACVPSMRNWCRNECRNRMVKEFGRSVDYKSECRVDFASACAKCECIRRTGFLDEDGKEEELNEYGTGKCARSEFKKEICEAGCPSDACVRSTRNGQAEYTCRCEESDDGYDDEESCLDDCDGRRCYRSTYDIDLESDLPSSLLSCGWQCSGSCHPSVEDCEDACDVGSGLKACEPYEDPYFDSLPCHRCVDARPPCLDAGTCEVVDGEVRYITKPPKVRKPRPTKKSPSSAVSLTLPLTLLLLPLLSLLAFF